ncbi:hypothetical protein HBH95_143060 [Parastagonospora nodorum]|nr:hypothetical protein HBH95_143060 [Parastagonospora nodorum]
MCAKNDLIRRKSLLSTSTQTPNYVDTFSSDFAFSFITILIRLLIARGNNILSLITFIISYCLFADKLNIQQSLLDRATVMLIIILVNKTQLSLILGDKHYNFNIYVSLATDTLHLLLKGLVIKMLDFIQDILDDIYPSKQKAIIQQLIAVVSLLFVLKAPFALHFIRAVYDLHALTYIIQDICIYRALDSICTRANSEAHHITIVKQFYSMINKKEYILQIYRKHIAYIRAFSKVLLFNNNRQINNTTRILSILQAFKFYDLSTIIRLVHLVLRDLPNLTTRTTMSYYVNNYIN